MDEDKNKISVHKGLKKINLNLLQNQGQGLCQILLNNYINFQIYKFLHAKASKFVNYKQAIYFIKPLERKQLSGNKNISQAIENWLDEIYIGKYDILPQIEIKNLNSSSFMIELSIYNKINSKCSLPTYGCLNSSISFSACFIIFVNS